MGSKKIQLHPPAKRRSPSVATHGNLYLGLQSGRQGKIKIGITTRDPAKRRRQIETASGQRFDQFESFWVYAPGRAEAHLKKKLSAAGLALEGEWVSAMHTTKGTEYLYARLCRYMQARSVRRLPEHDQEAA